MTNQVVLITGALSGIGRATAVAFANKGAKVVVSGRHDDKGQELATELRALGAEAEFVRADVQNEDEVRDLVDKTVARFGRLDVAVNNAGVEGETGVIENATFALLIEQQPEARASALWNFAYDAGYGFGPAAFGLFSVRTGYPVAFALTGALMIAVLPAALRERRTAA